MPEIDAGECLELLQAEADVGRQIYVGKLVHQVLGLANEHGIDVTHEAKSLLRGITERVNVGTERIKSLYESVYHDLFPADALDVRELLQKVIIRMGNKD